MSASQHQWQLGDDGEIVGLAPEDKALRLADDTELLDTVQSSLPQPRSSLAMSLSPTISFEFSTRSALELCLQRLEESRTPPPISSFASIFEMSRTTVEILQDSPDQASFTMKIIESRGRNTNTTSIDGTLMACESDEVVVRGSISIQDPLLAFIVLLIFTGLVGIFTSTFPALCLAGPVLAIISLYWGHAQRIDKLHELHRVLRGSSELTLY